MLWLPISVSAGAYFIEYTSGGSKVRREWDPPTIRWRYNPSGAPAGAKEIIEAAFTTWKTQTQSLVTFEFAGTTDQSFPANDGYCDVFFNVNFANLGLSNDIIALTFRNGAVSDILRSKSDRFLVDGDIVLNPALSNQWVTTTPTLATQLDVQEIITHEAGHLLGLAHSFLIDSMMYPAKPQASTDASLKALYRVPKRSLAQDDIAWLSNLYPNDQFAAATSKIAGRVYYGSDPFVGAQVVAIKVDEADQSFNFFPNESSGDLVVKGMKNVSTFSEEDGDFEIPGLEPGNYKIAVQDADGFLTFTLANVNDFLRTNASFNVMPTAFFKNPDCANGATLTPSNIASEFAGLSAFNLLAGRALCGVEILARTGAQNCLSTAEDSSSCDSDGGCTMAPSGSMEVMSFKGVALSFVGVLIILLSLKIAMREPRKKRLLPSDRAVNRKKNRR